MESQASLSATIDDNAKLYQSELENIRDRIFENFAKTRKMLRYGGPTGREYFGLYYNKIIAPSLKSYFTEIRNFPDEQKNINLFKEIMKTLGQYRNKIAADNFSIDASDFGEE